MAPQAKRAKESVHTQLLIHIPVLTLGKSIMQPWCFQSCSDLQLPLKVFGTNRHKCVDVGNFAAQLSSACFLMFSYSRVGCCCCCFQMQGKDRHYDLYNLLSQ